MKIINGKVPEKVRNKSERRENMELVIQFDCPECISVLTAEDGKFVLTKILSDESVYNALCPICRHKVQIIRNKVLEKRGIKIKRCIL